MTHNLDNPSLYPQHHHWATMKDRLQLYSNVVINIGDKLKLPNGKILTVVDYPFIDLNEETRLKVYINREGKKEKGTFGIIEDYKGSIAGLDNYTRFYKLEVTENLKLDI